jgi:hypothetical protein
MGRDSGAVGRAYPEGGWTDEYIRVGFPSWERRSCIALTQGGRAWEKDRTGNVHMSSSLDSGECEPDDGPDAGLGPGKVDDED